MALADRGRLFVCQRGRRSTVEMVHFDPTVNLGTLVSVMLALGVLFKLHGDVVRQLTALNVKVETMWRIYTNGTTHRRADEE
jgi:hypothetical protein